MTGCSVSDDALMTPVIEPGNSDSNSSGQIERTVLGQWEMVYDEASGQFSATPIRGGENHYNVTAWLFPPACNDCLKIDVISFKPALKYIELNVTLRNPTGFDAYDVRGIVMVETPGVGMQYPDAFTDLWDYGGFVTINPFLAYAVDQPKRKFAAKSSHSRIYRFSYNSLADFQGVVFTVDASWPVNCREPYELTQCHTTGPFVGLGKQDIECRVGSWNNDVNSVEVLLDDVLGYQYPVEMEPIGGGWWSAKDVYWHGGGAEPGTYGAVVLAKTQGSAIYLINYVTVTIETDQVINGWARAFGGDGPVYANAAATDSFGNIITGGMFYYTVDFDPGPGSYELTANGYVDAFMSRFDPSGDLIWARSWGGESSYYEEKVTAIEIDSGNNIYAGGMFYGENADLDPGPLVDEHSAGDNLDVFVSKFDPDGYLYWARNWGGDEEISLDGMCMDSEGNIYITGYFRGIIDFDPGPEVEERDAVSDHGIFLSSLDCNGDFRWVAAWPDMFADYYGSVFDVAADNSGRIFLTAALQGAVDFDPGPGIDTHSSGWATDAFLICLSETGDYLWGRSWGGASDDWGLAVDADKDGNIYVGGVFGDTVDFDPGEGVQEATSNGSYDVFISKFDPDGTFQWVRTWGGEYDDWVKRLDVSDAGSLAATGEYRYKVNFAGNQGEDFHTSNGYSDCFVASYDLNGDYLWADTFGGKYTDSGYDVTYNKSGKYMYTVGIFSYEVDFFPGPGVDIHEAGSNSDAYLMKLERDGSW